MCRLTLDDLACCLSRQRSRQGAQRLVGCPFIFVLASTPPSTAVAGESAGSPLVDVCRERLRMITPAVKLTATVLSFLTKRLLEALSFALVRAVDLRVVLDLARLLQF
jgi:hypothetical protein